MRERYEPVHGDCLYFSHEVPCSYFSFHAIGQTVIDKQVYIESKRTLCRKRF